MAYYPSIDYMGAAQSIINSTSDLARVDREREDMAMKRQLQEKQMTLYGLQNRKAQMEMDEMERERTFKKTLGTEILLNQEAGNFSPTIEEQDSQISPGDSPVPGPEKTLYSIKPPKMDFTDTVAKRLLGEGKIDEAIKLQDQAIKAKADKVKEFQNSVTWIKGIAETFPTLAKNLIKQDPRLSMLGEFITSPEGEVTAIEMKNKTGEVVAYVNPKNPKDAKWIVKAPTDANSILELQMERDAPGTSPERIKFIDSVLDADAKRKTKINRDSFVDTRNPYQATSYVDENGNPMSFDPRANTLVPVKTPGKVKKVGVEGAGKRDKPGLGDLKTKTGSSEGGNKSWKKWAQ